MSHFFTNEAISLDKNVELLENKSSSVSTLEQLSTIYEITKCADWIKSNKFTRICLQFPDHMLNHSSSILQLLQNELLNNETLFILADTAYESCCIDYVAAAHVNADAIIHFGSVCFSLTTRQVPVLFIYEKLHFDLNLFKNSILTRFSDLNNLVIVLDTSYQHLKQEIKQLLPPKVVLNCDLNDLQIDRENVVFICNSLPKITNFHLEYQPKNLFYYNGTILENFQLNMRLIKRRQFLIEKIKDSKTIGIVIGTLSVQNYLKQIERLKKLIENNKKKSYLISVGKPTIAKLANFPEIDIYVIVSCALNEIYENRDFYQPIVTCYDMEMALNQLNNQVQQTFSLDFNKFTLNAIETNIDNEVNDVSLITGQIRKRENNFEENEQTLEISIKDKGTIIVNSEFGAGFLSNREWRGLEQKVGESKIEFATDGRRGTPQHYQDEEFH